MLRRNGGHSEEGGTCSKPRETSLCHRRCSANTQTQQRLLYGDWLVNNRRCNREDQSKISIVNKSTCWKTLWWYLFERASKHDQTFVLVCKQLLIPQSKPEDGFEKQRLNWHAFCGLDRRNFWIFVQMSLQGYLWVTPQNGCTCHLRIQLLFFFH